MRTFAKIMTVGIAATLAFTVGAGLAGIIIYIGGVYALEAVIIPFVMTVYAAQQAAKLADNCWPQHSPTTPALAANPAQAATQSSNNIITTTLSNAIQPQASTAQSVITSSPQVAATSSNNVNLNQPQELGAGQDNNLSLSINNNDSSSDEEREPLLGYSH